MEPDSGPDWTPFAAFVIEIQLRRTGDIVETTTTVHHVETDRTRSWAGLAPTPVTAWIHAQSSHALRVAAQRLRGPP